ncbi:hypothetical protein NGRA_2594 [Nosema granulosis]|uniref:Integrase catalytic domain-containing protein n=1 Tax=Nosema granulosis TaxID=83296 RepID=A0A9P6GWR9_9MICR|nr:hypothetical protein NGRA_2594 [Nosema granulosis]
MTLVLVDSSNINDQKSAGGEGFVPTTASLKIIAMYLMFFYQRNIFSSCIDYYLRLIRVYEMESKEPKNILEAMKKIFNEIEPLETLMTDNEKEFTAGKVKRYLHDKNIRHHTISIEKTPIKWKV